jgi:hypothetical protein
MAHIRARLRVLLETLNLSPKAFAAELQLPRKYVRAVLSGTHAVTAKLLGRIRIQWRQVNIDWLLLGEGDVFLEAAQAQGNLVNINHGTVHQYCYNITPAAALDMRALLPAPQT